MRESVEWFANEMEKTLLVNDYKGGWERESLRDLFRSLMDEVLELYDRTEHMDVVYDEQVIKEAVDVANYAMMIADNVRRTK